jgi:hypothetical protein
MKILECRAILLRDETGKVRIDISDAGHCPAIHLTRELWERLEISISLDPSIVFMREAGAHGVLLTGNVEGGAFTLYDANRLPAFRSVINESERSMTVRSPGRRVWGINVVGDAPTESDST